MSATRRNGDRLGRFYTDIDVARAVVDWLPMLHHGAVVLEPHAGGGHILEALHERDQREGLGLYLHALDIDPAAPALLNASGVPYLSRCGDFLDPASVEGWARPWLVIGNPPYAVDRVEVAREHVERALQVTRRHVVFVLRQGFLSWTGKDTEDLAGRAAWWPLRRPRKVLHIVPRPSYTGAGTDSSESIVAWWDLAWKAPADMTGFEYDWLPTGRFACAA